MNKSSAKNELIFEKENIPKGWISTKLKNLCELVGGGTPSRQNLEYFDGNILWLTPTEIPKNKIIEIKDSREKITKLGLQKSSAKIIPKNAVLLTSRASIGYVAITGTEVTTNQGFASFVCGEILYNYFLAYWLFGNKSLLESKATGTIFKEISKSKLRELKLDIPPLSEQKRIVTKIESIFTQIDAKQEELLNLEFQIKTISDNIRELKGSILNHYLAGLEERCESKLLKDVCIDIQPGFAQGVKDVKGGIIHLRMNNISANFTMNFELLRTINATDTQQKKYLLHNNDVIFVNTNSQELVGKSAIFKFSKPCLYSNHLTRLRTDASILDPKLLLYQLHSKWMNREFKIMCNKWINQAAINTTKIKELQIIMPPLHEQKRIVQKIESIFDRIDSKQEEMKKMEIYLKSVPESFNALKSSILKLAFEGKLVPQDPNDEPASVLLDKIKSQNIAIGKHV